MADHSYLIKEHYSNASNKNILRYWIRNFARVHILTACRAVLQLFIKGSREDYGKIERDDNERSGKNK